MTTTEEQETLAKMILAACEVAGVRMEKTDNRITNLGVTPALAVAVQLQGLIGYIIAEKQ